MMNSELFRQTLMYEHSVDAEGLPPENYVRNLFAHAATIPDVSELPYYYTPPRDQAELLGHYCESNMPYNNSILAEKEIAPLFRGDIIEPHYCGNVERLTRRIAGTSPDNHWYKATYSEGSGYRSNEASYASRKWELAYVDYMRDRRIFHAQFMNALITQEPIDEHVAAIGTKDGKQIEVPYTNMHERDSQPAPNFMYNPTNWLTGSLLSALSLPPELCDGDMKRRAIELWAAHIDPTDASGMDNFYNLSDLEGPLQLPWSMRSNAELKTAHHPKWRDNRYIKEYLGNEWNERFDGLESLLQDRPKDYIQVHILRIFGSHNPKNALQDLVKVAALPDEVKDIIFADDAAFSTIYEDPSFSGREQPTSLIDLLDGNATDQTQESIIQGQQLRIQVLTEELERARAANDRDRLRQTIQDLEARAVHAEAVLAQQQPHLPRSEADLLMLNFGLSPAMNPAVLEGAVRVLRRYWNQELHTDKGGAADSGSPNLGEINTALDRILESRGLQKNQE